MHFPDIPKPSALFFDFDGVIAKSETVHLDSWAVAARSVCNLHLTQDHLDLLSGQNTSKILHRIAEFAGRSIDKTALLKSKEECLCRLGDQVKVFPGAQDLLASLSENGVPRAIVSNSRREFIKTVLAHNGIPPLPLISADDVRSPKPAPEPYLRAAKAVGLDLTEYSRAWVFEDSYTGLRSAKGASMFAFGIRTHFDDPYLKEAGAVATFADIAEVWEGLKAIGIL